MPSFHPLHHATFSLVCSSSCRGGSLIVLMHQFLSCLVSRNQGRGAISTVIHIFHTEESSVFQSVFGIWCESSLTCWVLRCCYSCSKLGAVRSLSPMIFPMESHFYAQGLCVSFPYRFVARAYVFPSVFWGLVQVSLTHRLGDCIPFLVWSV